jgi:hypothetical protein
VGAGKVVAAAVEMTAVAVGKETAAAMEEEESAEVR